MTDRATETQIIEDLIAFLKARYAEDASSPGGEGPPTAVGRRILAIAEECKGDYYEEWAFYRLPPILSLPFVDHPDYSGEWYPVDPDPHT